MARIRLRHLAIDAELVFSHDVCICLIRGSFTHLRIAARPVAHSLGVPTLARTQDVAPLGAGRFFAAFVEWKTAAALRDDLGDRLSVLDVESFAPRDLQPV